MSSGGASPSAGDAGGKQALPTPLPSSKPPRYHVAIIGAGLGGLAAAIGVARAGHKVSVIERAPELGEVGAGMHAYDAAPKYAFFDQWSNLGIQIPPNAAKILERWGLLADIERWSVEPNNFILRSYSDGRVLSKQNLVPFVRERYSSPYFHIHRADYHRLLTREAARLGVNILLGCEVVSLDFYRPSIRIKGRKEFRADLVIGADGLRSICREQLLGQPDHPHLTGDLAYRIIVKAEDMKRNELLRELAETPEINYWMGPDSHAVCYLLKGGNLYNIVLICPDNLPDLVNTERADLQEMLEYFEDWDPKLKALLSMVQDTSKWRLQNSEELKNWSHPSGNFALLGDACHATLPYLAQGAAMAIEDGAVLGALMEKIEHKTQLKDVLVIYEELRKNRTTSVVKGSTALQDIFHMHDGDRQQERDRQLTEMEPFESFPNRWADPIFQPWLFGYDPFEQVDKAWEVYKSGRFPRTFGKFKSRM